MWGCTHPLGSGPTLWKHSLCVTYKQAFSRRSQGLFLCSYRKLNQCTSGREYVNWGFLVAIINQQAEFLGWSLPRWSLVRVHNEMWLSQAWGKHLNLKNRLQRPAGIITYKLPFNLFQVFYHVGMWSSFLWTSSFLSGTKYIVFNWLDISHRHRMTPVPNPESIFQE